MKISAKAALLSLTFAASASLSHAQVYLHSQLVDGDFSSGVVTRFDFAIDVANDKLTITVDNTVPRPNGLGTRGTVISFGFNTPFSGLTTSNVASTVDFLQINPGHSISGAKQNITGSSNGFWEEHAGYTLAHQGTTYDQDFGVSTDDNPSNAAGTSKAYQGVQFGEIATFEFSFNTKNITEGNYKNFFGNDFISVYWRDVEEVYQTSEKKKVWKNGGWKYEWVTVTKERDRNNGWDKGLADFNPPFEGDLPMTPEPSTYGLMGAGALLGLVAHRRMKSKKTPKA